MYLFSPCIYQYTAIYKNNVMLIVIYVPSCPGSPFCPGGPGGPGGPTNPGIARTPRSSRGPRDSEGAGGPGCPA